MTSDPRHHGREALTLADLWRAMGAAFEAQMPLIAPVAAAFFFFPGLAAALVFEWLGTPEESPARLLALFGLLVVGTIGQGAVMLIVLGGARPDSETVAGAIKTARAALPRLLLSSMAVGLALGFGLLALILPGFYLLGRLCVAPVAVLVERAGVTDGVSRAWQLTKGREGAAIGLMALILIFGVVAFFIGVLLLPGLTAVGAMLGVEGAGRLAGMSALQAIGASVQTALAVAPAVLYRALARGEIVERS